MIVAESTVVRVGHHSTVSLALTCCVLKVAQPAPALNPHACLLQRSVAQQ